MKHYLLPLLLVLAGRLAAQTPAPTATPPAPSTANWYIFNQPLDAAPAAKPSTPSPKEVKPAATVTMPAPRPPMKGLTVWISDIQLFTLSLIHISQPTRLGMI